MANADSHEREYVLGTGDSEIERLFLQHSVWRAECSAAWRRAGFDTGKTILDVGCGPGAAALDLAALVGASGCVIAIDQSTRFLEHLSARATDQHAANIEIIHCDLASSNQDLPVADGAWLRWILAFVPQPRRLLERTCATLRPGGRIVVHEYFAYETWQTIPVDDGFSAFVHAVMSSWRARGGEPNVGLNVPGWLEAQGFEIIGVKPMVDVVTARDPRWLWPTSFAASGLARLLELGDVSADDGARMAESIERLQTGGLRMMTPAVLEVIAEKGDAS